MKGFKKFALALGVASVMAASLGTMAGCGGEKIVYTDYTLDDYTSVSWQEKKIAFQIRDEGFFPMCMNLYEDHGLYAVHSLFGGNEKLAYYGYWTEENNVLKLTYYFDDMDEGYLIVSNLTFNADKSSFVASETETEQMGWVMMETQNGTSRTSGDKYLYSKTAVVEDPNGYWEYLQANKPKE